MPDAELDALMARIWVCLPCGTKTPFGEMRAADTMRCPKCGSANIEPIGQGALVVENSEWAIPPVTK